MGPIPTCKELKLKAMKHEAPNLIGEDIRHDYISTLDNQKFNHTTTH